MCVCVCVCVCVFVISRTPLEHAESTLKTGICAMYMHQYLMNRLRTW